MHPFVFGHIRSYFLFSLIGTAVGIAVMVLLLMSDTKNVRRSLLIGAVFAVVINVGNIGSQLLRKLTVWNFDSFESFIKSLPNYEGKHFLGSVIFTLIVFPIVWKLIMRRESGVFAKQGLMRAMDVTAFFMTVQHFFNRIACLMNGCCYGKAYYGPFAFKFPETVVGHPVYPTQAIEMGGMIILLAVMAVLWIWKKPALPVFCVGFGTVIFISETFMDNLGTRLILGWSFIKLCAFVLVIAGLIMIAAMRNEYVKRRK